MFVVVIVAQLVEPRIVIPVVVGSSPISHPISTNVEFRCLNESKKTQSSMLLLFSITNLEIVNRLNEL